MKSTAAQQIVILTRIANAAPMKSGLQEATHAIAEKQNAQALTASVNKGLVVDSGRNIKKDTAVSPANAHLLPN